MRAVDTNILVRLITRDDPKQATDAERYIAPGAWVPTLALAEAAWVLEAVYDCKPDAIATAVDMLLNHQQLTLQDADAVGHAVQQFRRRPAIGFSDCLMLAVSGKAGHTPLGTFDRNLAKLDGAQRV